MSIPDRIKSNWRFEILPTSSVSKVRSSVISCEAFATESLGKPVALAGSITFPGASVHRRLLVNGTQTTVLSLLRLSGSPWTTKTGLRKPGPEPVGSGRFAQYRWPWEITTRRLQVCAAPRPQRLDPGTCPPLRRLDSSPRSPHRGRVARRIRSRLPRKSDFETFSIDAKAAPPPGKSCRESRSPFSYPKNNREFLRRQVDKVFNEAFGIQRSVIGAEPRLENHD